MVHPTLSDDPAHLLDRRAIQCLPDRAVLAVNWAYRATIRQGEPSNDLSCTDEGLLISQRNRLAEFKVRIVGTIATWPELATTTMSTDGCVDAG